jgi:hypothetical protein
MLGQIISKHKLKSSYFCTPVFRRKIFQQEYNFLVSENNLTLSAFMQRNYIPQAFYFTLAVAGVLLLLSFFHQERTVFGCTLKP